MAQEEKVSKFLEAITKDALRRKEKILKEIDDFNKEELEKAEDEALSEAYALIQGEISNTRSELRREYCLLEMEKRKQLFQRRSEITAQVFERAQDMLKEYAAADEYHSDFFKDLKQAAEQFSSGKVIIMIRSQDLPFENEIRALFPNNCTIEEDKTITIGGFRLKDLQHGLLADNTLDVKLEQQRDWFLENSGLSIA